MPAHERDVIDQYADDLTQLLDVSSVLRGLTKYKVFTKTLAFEVSKKLAHERASKLFDILTTRGVNAFAGFCRVLKDEGEIELAYCLQRDAYQKPVEIFW